MRIGKLRHRIEIQRFVTQEDEWGNEFSGWETLAHVWAAVEPLKGEEYYAARQAVAEVSHKVTMRSPGEKITPLDRIVFEDRIFEIESVLDIEERGRELVLMCKEKLGEVSTASVEPEPNEPG